MTSTPSDTQFASALSDSPHAPTAVDEVSHAIRQTLGSPPNLACVFFTVEHLPHVDELVSLLCDGLGTEQIIGCSAESVVGAGREVEEGPAISVWAARSEAFRAPLQLTMERTPDGMMTTGWPDDLTEWPPDRSLILLADPFSFATDLLLERIQSEQPQLQVVGGMASAGYAPGMNRLLFGRSVRRDGAVGLVVAGELQPRPLVSQGCRPIGQPYVITKAERNLIFELGGQPAVQRLHEVFNSLANREKEQAQRGIHLGRVVSEYQDQFSQGDFLVRNVVGIDAETGGLTMGDYYRPGQTIQFHVRDRDTADAELEERMAAIDDVPRAALVFTCNGRGTKLFEKPDHDAAALQRRWGEIPVAGMFAQGEIGPVGGGNFVHGFTASMALFG